MGDVGVLRQHCAALVAGSGRVEGTWHVEIGDDATVSVEELGVVVTEAHTLSASEVEAVGEIVAVAADPVPVPVTEPAAGESPAAVEVPDPDVLVRVLGPVDVVRRDATPVEFRRARAEEFIVFVALAGGSTSTGTVDEEIWPDAANQKTRANAVSEARRELGEGSDGVPMLGPAGDGRYTLTGVATDWDQFRVLARWGSRHRGPEGDAALVEALEAVRGAPMRPVRGRYGWAVDYEQAMIAGIVDAAEELAQRRLDQQDWANAEHAARLGLRVDIPDERFYRVLLLAAHGEANTAKTQAVYRELRRAVEELEPFTELEPATLQVLDQVLPRVRARRSA